MVREYHLMKSKAIDCGLDRDRHSEAKEREREREREREGSDDKGQRTCSFLLSCFEKPFCHTLLKNL